MQTELYKAIDKVNIQEITEADKQDLLVLFEHTQNVALANRITVIFHDLYYHVAVPSILEKIHSPQYYNRNGTMVWALGNLNLKEHYQDLFKIICEQDYEARLMAHHIIVDRLPEIPEKDKIAALNILNTSLAQFDAIEDDNEYESSRLHFVEATIKLLKEKS